METTSPFNLISPFVWFILKVYFILFFFIWLRGTVPRLRYDQLMKLGWKIMLPIAFVNLIVTAIVIYWIK
jgi:NADH-quinone oxidoreductase subunit H